MGYVVPPPQIFFFWGGDRPPCPPLDYARASRPPRAEADASRTTSLTKVPWNEWSRERMFQGTNSLENESSRERMVQGTNVPRNEWSRERKFHHGNECSRERIVLGTNIPDTLSNALESAHFHRQMAPLFSQNSYQNWEKIQKSVKKFVHPTSYR